jgi:sarcosine oxidase/L-pipecolate oxidase
MSPRTVLVVGAGIFGVTSALEFRRRGWRVHLFDAGPIPHPLAQSSSQPMMIRLDYRTDEDYTALVETALEGWREWNRSWPEPPFHETGLLMLRRSEMARGEFEHDSYHTLLKRGHAPIRLSPEKIRDRYPAWNSSRYIDGYFNPEGGYVEAERAVAHLLQLGQTEGVVVHQGQGFAHLLEAGSRVGGIVGRDGAKFKGDLVIIAAGAWIPHLLPALAPAFRKNGSPIFHLRPGQPEQFQPERFPPFTAEIARTGYYGYPLQGPEGAVVIARQGTGRAVDPDGERAVTPAETAHLRLFLAETFPRLFDAPILSMRFSVYCETWDGHFWIAADPERDGLVVATGGDHAFKFAPLLGGIVADAAEGRTDPLLHKFRWRPEIRQPASTPIPAGAE